MALFSFKPFKVWSDYNTAAVITRLEAAEWRSDPDQTQVLEVGAADETEEDKGTSQL